MKRTIPILLASALLLASCESVKSFMARDLEEEDFIIGQLYVDELVNETPVIASRVTPKPQRGSDGRECNNALGLRCNDDDNQDLYETVNSWLGVGGQVDFGATLFDYNSYQLDDKGNQLSSLKITDPENYAIDRIISVKPDAEGKTLEAIVEVYGAKSFQTAIVKIDIESGTAGSLVFLEKDLNAVNLFLRIFIAVDKIIWWLGSIFLYLKNRDYVITY